MTDDKAVSLNETSVIESLGEEERYKFLGVLEGVKQEERQSLRVRRRRTYSACPVPSPTTTKCWHPTSLLYRS